MGEAIITDLNDPRHPGWTGIFNDMPNPTEADLTDPVFNCIWETTKRWDLNVPDCYAGYCGMNGSHVMIILNALREAKLV